MAVAVAEPQQHLTSIIAAVYTGAYLCQTPGIEIQLPIARKIALNYTHHTLLSVSPPIDIGAIVKSSLIIEQPSKLHAI